MSDSLVRDTKVEVGTGETGGGGVEPGVETVVEPEAMTGIWDMDSGPNKWTINCQCIAIDATVGQAFAPLSLSFSHSLTRSLSFYNP